MPRWYECANEASFKAVPEGHVFQAPSPWMLTRPRYYLVSDAQKAELLVRLGRWRLLLMIVTLIELSSLALALMLPTMLWPATFGRLLPAMHHQLGTGLFLVLLIILTTLLTVPFLAVPQIYLARALRPILANAPRSEKRITLSEQLPKIAASAPTKLLIVGLSCGSIMISCGIFLMFDAFVDGRLGRSALSSATFVLLGGLQASYLMYLLRLRAKSKPAKIA